MEASALANGHEAAKLSSSTSRKMIRHVIYKPVFSRHISPEPPMPKARGPEETKERHLHDITGAAPNNNAAIQKRRRGWHRLHNMAQIGCMRPPGEPQM